MSEKQLPCPVCGNLRPEGRAKCHCCGSGWNVKQCPGCGKFMSEEAMSCPHCGYHMESARDGSQSKQKQLLMVFLIIVILGGAAGGFGLMRHKRADLSRKEEPPSTSEAMTDETIAPDKASEPETFESRAAKAENTYEQMLSAGSYTEVLEAILGLDIADLGTEEKEALADTLSKAVDGQYAQFEERVSSLQNAGNYDDALTAVDEEARLYNQLIENALTEQYIEISWPLAEKRIEIMRSHVAYLLDLGRSEVVYQWDETDLNSNILDRLQGYVDEGILTQGEFDRKRAVIYGIFVNGKIASMGQEGADAVSVLAYIVEKIADTGYNCQTIEYWDFYMSVIGKGAGNPTLISAKSADGYLLPGSDSGKLGVSDVSGFSRDELRLAIYEIFARHGYIFQDQAVNTYFRNCSWYHANSSFEEENLNEYERANLAMLVNCMFDRYS